MDYLATIIKTSPLKLHFCFHNPSDAGGPAYVPRILGPLGYFVELEIFNQYDELVHETFAPKIKLKLNPKKQESYISIDPGYTYGSVLEIEDFTPVPGNYQVALTYSNQEFDGFKNNSLGEMQYQTKIKFEFS